MNYLKCIITLVLLSSFANLAVGQNEERENNRGTIYTFFVNVAQDQFIFPLIGFINISNGSQKNAHVGFINLNREDINGAQVGFINANGRDTDGAQVGFVNVNGRSFEGAQVGFVNVNGRNSTGARVGFINVNGQKSTGGQIGFINTTRQLSGFQLGFINYADSVEAGMPFGFLSIIRKGGHQALEISTSELYPVNISFQSGVEKLYTAIGVSYNSELAQKYASRVGVGSFIKTGRSSIYINPELSYQNSIGKNTNAQTVSFATNVGYYFNSRVHAAVGLSLAWHYNRIDDDPSSIFSIQIDNINNEQQLLAGLRLALRYNFSKAR